MALREEAMPHLKWVRHGQGLTIEGKIRSIVGSARGKGLGNFSC